MSPFGNFYNNFRYKLYCLEGRAYILFTEGSEGAIILKDLIFRTFNYVEQHEYLKILIGCVWKNGERERALVAIQTLSTIKKGTSPFNFQLNELF
jgi:hypothetical protein